MSEDRGPERKMAIAETRMDVTESTSGVVRINGTIMHVDYPGYCREWADNINAAAQTLVDEAYERAAKVAESVTVQNVFDQPGEVVTSPGKQISYAIRALKGRIERKGGE